MFYLVGAVATMHAGGDSESSQQAGWAKLNACWWHAGSDQHVQ